MADSNSSKVNFTRGRVDKFKCPAGRSESFLWDSSTPGLGIRARKSGRKSYIFQGWLNGRGVRVSIGPVSSWDIDDAQTEARRLRVLVDSGIHPRDEQRQKAEQEAADRAEAQRATITLGDIWPGYIEARKSDWGDAHLHDHYRAMQAPDQTRKRSRKLTKPGVLYALHDERLADLTADRLLAWLEREKQTRPTSASRAYRLLRACLSWCDEQPKYCGLVDTRRVLNKSVRRAVPKSRTKDDVLQREQLAPWFKAVQSYGNPTIEAYLQALLLTGARRREMAALKWRDIDFEWRSIILRDKVEGDRTIPFTPYLAQLLASLPRRNAYVFYSPTAEAGYIADGNHAHARIIETAGLPHTTLHGLRRSFGTLSEWVECPVGVVAQIQGHKPSAIAEKHYRRRPLDLLRMWHTRIEGWILEQADIGQPSDNEATGLRLVRGGDND